MGISPIRKKKKLDNRRRKERKKRRGEKRKEKRGKEGKAQARKVVNRKDILKQFGKTPISVLSAI